MATIHPMLDFMNIISKIIVAFTKNSETKLVRFLQDQGLSCPMHGLKFQSSETSRFARPMPFWQTHKQPAQIFPTIILVSRVKHKSTQVARVLTRDGVQAFIARGSSCCVPYKIASAEFRQQSRRPLIVKVNNALRRLLVAKDVTIPDGFSPVMVLQLLMTQMMALYIGKS